MHSFNKGIDLARGRNGAEGMRWNKKRTVHCNGEHMPSAELEKAVNERGISSRTMRTAKSRIGDRLVTEKDGTAWVCYLRD